MDTGKAHRPRRWDGGRDGAGESAGGREEKERLEGAEGAGARYC